VSENDRPLPLKEQAYRHLLDLLMSDEVPPGAFLSERQLVARLGMSKTPIRVALERLDRDGFVEILPQRGVRLRELTAPEIVDYYDFRIALESWVVRRVAAKAGAREVRELRRIVERQRKLLETGGGDVVSRYIEVDAALHQTLAELAGNAEILRALETQRGKLTRVMSGILPRDPEWLQSTTGEHEAIVDAIERGDGEAAARELVAHLEHGREFVRSAV
jgi:GntR family transcriptional regulator, rspAB operon transcriptional repressor